MESTGAILCTCLDLCIPAFAAEGALRSLPFFEELFPSDQRIRIAIETRQAYSQGQATRKEDEAARQNAFVAWGVIINELHSRERQIALFAANAAITRSASNSLEYSALAAAWTQPDPNSSAFSNLYEKEQAWQWQRLQYYLSIDKQEGKKN